MGMLDAIDRFVSGNKQPAGGNQPNQSGQGSGFTPSNGNQNMQFQQAANNGQNNAGTNQGGATVPGENQNGSQGDGGQNTGQPKAEPHPMDRFGKLFDNSAKPEEAPKFALDGKTLDDVAKSQDFYKGIDPELMARAQSGDVQAMQQMNALAMQNMYKTVLQHGGTLNERFVSAREEFGNKGFSGRVKSELTAAQMAEHPAMKNPVVKRQLNATAEQFAKQHPDASPAEIKQMTMDYFKELGSLFGEKKEEPSVEGKPDSDFRTWFGDEPAAGQSAQGGGYFN